MKKTLSLIMVFAGAIFQLWAAEPDYDFFRSGRQNNCRFNQPRIRSSSTGADSVQTARSKTLIGFVLGPNYTFVKFRLPFQGFELSADYKHKPGYAFGISLNHAVPAISKNLSVQTEFIYCRTNFESSYSFYRYLPIEDPTLPEPKFEIVNYALTADFKISTIKLPVLVRYTFNSKKLQPYLNAGIVLNHNLSVTDRPIMERSTEFSTTFLDVPTYSANKYYFLLVGGAGFNLLLNNDRAVFLELRYQPEGINKLYGLTSSVNTAFINTGFRF